MPISRGEYYRRVLRRFGSRTMLSGIIKEELFRQEAARRGLTVSRDEIQARVDRLMEEEKERAGGPEELRRIYRQEGLSLEEVATRTGCGGTCTACVPDLVQYLAAPATC